MRWLLPLLCAVAAGQIEPSRVDISAGETWTNTGLDLRIDDRIVITVTGNLDLPDGRVATAAGAQRGFRDLIKSYQVNEAGLGAVIGRIGSSDAANPFLVGTSKTIQVPHAGRLFLGINKTSSDSLSGTFHASITFVSRGPTTPRSSADLKLPEIPLSVVDAIPRHLCHSGVPHRVCEIILPHPAHSCVLYL